MLKFKQLNKKIRKKVMETEEFKLPWQDDQKWSQNPDSSSSSLYTPKASRKTATPHLHPSFSPSLIDLHRTISACKASAAARFFRFRYSTPTNRTPSVSEPEPERVVQPSEPPGFWNSADKKPVEPHKP